MSYRGRVASGYKTGCLALFECTAPSLGYAIMVPGVLRSPEESLEGSAFFLAILDCFALPLAPLVGDVLPVA